MFRCFHLLPIVNNADMNIGVKISIQVPPFNSFMYIPKSRIVESNEIQQLLNILYLTLS